MFRRWLMLMRDGPDLLAATSLDRVALAVERCDCDLHGRETAVSVIPSTGVARVSWSAPSKLTPAEYRPDSSK
jgi:hypothetical protein